MSVIVELNNKESLSSGQIAKFVIDIDPYDCYILTTTVTVTPMIGPSKERAQFVIYARGLYTLQAQIPYSTYDKDGNLISSSYSCYVVTLVSGYTDVFEISSSMGSPFSFTQSDTYYDPSTYSANIVVSMGGKFDIGHGYNPQYSQNSYLIHYINNYYTTTPAPLPEPDSHGQGVTTLTISAGGQRLTFISRLSGIVKTVHVNNDKTVDLNDMSWEIMWMFYYYGKEGIMLIDSNFNCTTYITDIHYLPNVEGSILKYTSASWRISAKKQCAVLQGQANVRRLKQASVKQDGFIATYPTTYSDFPEIFVLAKANLSARIPYEVGLYWKHPIYNTAQYCIIKANEPSVVAYSSGNTITGDRMSLRYDDSSYRMIISTIPGSTFQGKIKAADKNVTGYWQEIDASSENSMYGSFGIALAIPD